MRMRIATTTLLVLSLSAAGAPVASAEFIAGDAPSAPTSAPAAVYSRPDRTMVPVSSPTPSAAVAKGTSLPPVVHVQATSGGFDWGDAGIGAAGGLALSMIGIGGAFAASQRRSRRTTALPS